ncbi:MAG: hypothetical protein NWE99_10375 [Candidatus Bathyarchaeota archaeon]|nr:hypothetical protein [Candidatus Bathyarchaeota archaeon]
MVTDSVKALPKKRGHQTKRNLNLTFASAAGAVKYQALWYAACISLYAWCMYWISRDIFVWHKPLAEISVLSYAGSVASIALIWLGNRIWRSRPKEVQKGVRKVPQPVKQPLEQPLEPMKQPLPPAETVAAGSACTHYLGYLHERKKSKAIPAECLTCEEVIQCFSAQK